MIEEDDLIFTEEDSIPLEFYEAMPDETIVDGLYKSGYFLSAQTDGEYCGIAVFYLTRDNSGAVLSYIFVKSGFRSMGIGSALIKTAHERLSALGCMDMICLAYNDDVEIATGLLKNCGFRRVSEWAVRLTYDYEDVLKAVGNKRETKNNIGYLTDEDKITAYSAAAAEILRNIHIPFMCHEGEKGAGRFCINEENELTGIMLGSYNPYGDLAITAYNDEIIEDKPTLFLPLLYEELYGFCESSNFDNRFSIICSTPLQRDMVEGLIGIGEKTESAVELRLLPEEISRQ